MTKFKKYINKNSIDYKKVDIDFFEHIIKENVFCNENFAIVEIANISNDLFNINQMTLIMKWTMKKYLKNSNCTIDRMTVVSEVTNKQGKTYINLESFVYYDEIFSTVKALTNATSSIKLKTFESNFLENKINKQEFSLKQLVKYI